MRVGGGGVSPQAVGKWHQRFLDNGVEGLYDEPRAGRARTYGDERVAGPINRARQDKPKGSTHWSTRSLTKSEGLSQSTVSHWLRLFGVKPRLSKTFKLSTDPFFVEKVQDIVGLYMNPPDHAIVLCADEKTAVQALDRTQPALPLVPSYAEGYNHDYIRNGATTLFAALDMASGKVIAKCSKRHRHQEFLEFLRLLDSEVPADLAVHLVADNHATHKHGRVQAWLTARPRNHLHFTPTYSSWLNQVERWFGLLSERAIKRGCFKSEHGLMFRIHEFKREYNKNATPFEWVATTRSILSKSERLCIRISDSPN